MIILLDIDKSCKSARMSLSIHSGGCEMNLNFSWVCALCFSPLLRVLFPAVVWAGEAPYKPVPSSDGIVVVCPTQNEGDTSVLVCSRGVYVIVGEQVLVPVSPVEDDQRQTVPRAVFPDSQFPHPINDPFFQGFPGTDLPAGVIGH